MKYQRRSHTPAAEVPLTPLEPLPPRATMHHPNAETESMKHSKGPRLFLHVLARVNAPLATAMLEAEAIASPLST